MMVAALQRSLQERGGGDGGTHTDNWGWGRFSSHKGTELGFKGESALSRHSREKQATLHLFVID